MLTRVCGLPWWQDEEPAGTHGHAQLHSHAHTPEDADFKAIFDLQEPNPGNEKSVDMPAGLLLSIGSLQPNGA